MSASKDKKQRRMAREAGTDKQTLARQEEEEKKRREKTRWTVGTVVAVILIALILVANTNLFYNAIPSVEIGDARYTNSEYQYYYYSAYYQFSDDYKDYLNYFLDTRRPLNDQAFDGTLLSLFGISVPEALSDNEIYPEPTWADYFREVALSNMTQVTAIYEKAVAEGYTLSDEDAAAIDSEIGSFETYAGYYGYPNAKNYISAAYGRGCNEKIIRKHMAMQAIASDYSYEIYSGFTYTAEELAAWYEENKDTYDTFDYLYYLVKADAVEVVNDVTDEETGEVSQETSEEVTEETMAAAKETADKLAGAAIDEESFARAVAELAEDAEPTAAEGVSGYSLSSLYSEWMLDASRVAGDVTVAESEGSGYYVVLFQNRDGNTYNTVSARHILVKAEDSDADGAYSDEEMAAAKAKIDEIYAQWKAGAATEESFAELANEKSEDGGSNTKGGLYENICKGQMVEQFNDFCFDEGRKPGDTGIVMGSASSYAGYHLVYFVGEDEPYCDYLADGNLRNADYQAWQDGIMEGYAANTNFVIKFAEK